MRADTGEDEGLTGKMYLALCVLICVLICVLMLSFYMWFYMYADTGEDEGLTEEIYLSLLRTKHIVPALVSQDQALDAFYEVSVISYVSLSLSLSLSLSRTHSL